MITVSIFPCKVHLDQKKSWFALVVVCDTLMYALSKTLTENFTCEHT